MTSPSTRYASWSACAPRRAPTGSPGLRFTARSPADRPIFHFRPSGIRARPQIVQPCWPIARSAQTSGLTGSSLPSLVPGVSGRIFDSSRGSAPGPDFIRRSNSSSKICQLIWRSAATTLCVQCLPTNGPLHEPEHFITVVRDEQASKTRPDQVSNSAAPVPPMKASNRRMMR